MMEECTKKAWGHAGADAGHAVAWQMGVMPKHMRGMLEQMGANWGRCRAWAVDACQLGDGGPWEARKGSSPGELTGANRA